ncbi:Disease resistance protein RPP13 [Forsythia ovata]|uniref:Disease resistance protein RPP13 n=1 Tax=Forsythia ovata TaxID=205694 RepID=A0ABD1WTW0_9LAMI
MAEDIKYMRAKVKDMYEDKRFGFEALQVGQPSTIKEKKAPIVEEDNVVGFEDEAEIITNLLTKGSEELEVISIVGMAGLGKTTLAKMIYRDPKIEYEFYSRAWVYVSQEYSRKEVLLIILRQLIKPTTSMCDMNDVELADELRKVLEKGKYLIVMDDVWTNEAWDDFKNAFPSNKKNSRILLTSRIDTVAMHANPNIEPHNLRFLTSDESLTLLQMKALGSKEFPDELREHGLRIVKKCKGLPLAIVMIGGILRAKGMESHWWEKVAQRFIQQNEGMSLEDIAEEYLEDLINRNLVMVKDRRSNGKVKTCQVHDMLHLFCKNQGSQENFFHEVKQFNRVTYLSSNPNLENYRRLCIHSYISDYLSSKPSGLRVRSFLCFAHEEITLQPEHISSIPGAFKLLRVLDGKPIRFTRFPADITQLIHLRYIVLTGNFKILPKDLSSLWNIQTLIVETSSRTLEIKADVWKMIQLRHLKTNASTSLPTNASTSLLGPLAKRRKTTEDSSRNGNLKTVSTISPESCTEDVFAAAPNLSKLGIRGQLAKLLDVKGGSSLFDSLGKLDYLENLKLWNDVFPSPPSQGKIVSLPQSYKFPSKLKKLTIVETMLDWKQMSTLGMLESLEILKLKDNAFKGDLWKPQDGGFRSLKVLHIGRTDLVYWEASARHFPGLRCLRLKHCNKLEAVPVGLAEVSSFLILELNCTTEQAARSARKIQQRKQNMQFKLSIYPPSHDQ